MLRFFQLEAALHRVADLEPHWPGRQHAGVPMELLAKATSRTFQPGLLGVVASTRGCSEVLPPPLHSFWECCVEKYCSKPQHGKRSGLSNYTGALSARHKSQDTIKSPSRQQSTTQPTGVLKQ